MLMRAAKMKRRLSNKTILYLFRQILMAVHELRTVSNLCHLDIKPDNFAIRPDGTLALIDFGHAMPPGILTNRRTGTKDYAAPEVAFSIENPQYGY